MSGKRSKDYEEGRSDGAKYQRDSNAHQWSTRAGFGADPSDGNDEYSAGVKDGRANVRKGK